MYCNEKNTYRNVTFVCTVLFRLKHCFYLGECLIKALKLNLFRFVRNFIHVLIVHLQEVILESAGPKYVSASAYERCPFAGG